MNAVNGVSSGTFWVSLALVNAGLAEGKDRSRSAWFLLSLLLGPVATFLIIALASPQRQPAASHYASIDGDQPDPS